MGSVIRVGMTPAADRTAAGFSYRTFDGTIDKITFQKKDDYIVSANDTGYTIVDVTNYAKADILVSGNMVVMPATAGQDLYVGYFPNTSRPAIGVNNTLDYTNIVKVVPNDLQAAAGTNSDGILTIPAIRIGDQVALIANPASKYYTYWTDMTGDTDGDGYISIAELAAAGTRRRDADKRSNNPMYVIGNTMTFKVDQDNTRYYYEFKEGTESETTIQGEIRRENSTLYDLANNTPKRSSTPVVGAYVNVGGVVGQTNVMGIYTVTLGGVFPDSGEFSVVLSANG